MRRTLSEKMQDALQWAASFSGVCFRCVPLKFANAQDIISGKGSIAYGGRFNFIGRFEVLYLSCDVHTSIEETTKSQLHSGFEVAMTLPSITVGIEAQLSCVLNLTDATIRRRLGITKRSLSMPDWEKRQNLDKQEAFTQQIGRLARNADFEAILVPSAATRGKNLDVFPDRLLEGSYLKVINRHLLPPER